MSSDSQSRKSLSNDQDEDDDVRFETWLFALHYLLISNFVFVVSLLSVYFEILVLSKLQQLQVDPSLLTRIAIEDQKQIPTSPPSLLNNKLIISRARVDRLRSFQLNPNKKSLTNASLVLDGQNHVLVIMSQYFSDAESMVIDLVTNQIYHHPQMDNLTGVGKYVKWTVLSDKDQRDLAFGSFKDFETVTDTKVFNIPRSKIASIFSMYREYEFLHTSRDDKNYFSITPESMAIESFEKRTLVCRKITPLYTGDDFNRLERHLAHLDSAPCSQMQFGDFEIERRFYRNELEYFMLTPHSGIVFIAPNSYFAQPDNPMMFIPLEINESHYLIHDVVVVPMTGEGIWLKRDKTEYPECLTADTKDRHYLILVLHSELDTMNLDLITLSET